MPEDDPVRRIPINQLHQEPGDHELASSPDMKPYLDFIKAVIQDHDPAPELEAIRPVAPGKTIHLACGIGAEMGPCRLREHEHRGRQADFDTSRFRQGHGSRFVQLPLEKRYIWRVASALKWGLADCESMSIEADKQTLTPADFAKVMDLLKFRPMQLAIVLKALVGVEDMQRMMVEAIGAAKPG